MLATSHATAKVRVPNPLRPKRMMMKTTVALKTAAVNAGSVNRRKA